MCAAAAAASVQCRRRRWLVDGWRRAPPSCQSYYVSAQLRPPRCITVYLQVLTRDDSSIWPGMSAPAKQAVKTEMLACIKEEQQRGVTKKVRNNQQHWAALGSSSTEQPSAGDGWWWWSCRRGSSSGGRLERGGPLAGAQARDATARRCTCCGVRHSDCVPVVMPQARTAAACGACCAGLWLRVGGSWLHWCCHFDLFNRTPCWALVRVAHSALFKLVVCPTGFRSATACRRW